jgi:hypothetical protein
MLDDAVDVTRSLLCMNSFVGRGVGGLVPRIGIKLTFAYEKLSESTYCPITAAGFVLQGSAKQVNAAITRLPCIQKVPVSNPVRPTFSCFRSISE